MRGSGTGVLSRGTGEDDIFTALVERGSERLNQIWLGDGYEAVLRAFAEVSDWIGVSLEAGRRLRT
ncbi:MAG: hypothetical protein M3Q67_08465 [Actinomycetota bacterium]|nr:hypothetical protein [Actinomycetota bacterium]